MCNIIVINKGEKEIHTINQFFNHFWFILGKENYYNLIEIDDCLCQFDYEKALKDNNIQFKKYFGDIYVGMLHSIITDDD